MIRFIILAILSFNVYSNECTWLDANQKKVVQFSYGKGSEYNIGYTLAAISIVESSAGKNLINFRDPSFGHYQILFKTAKNLVGDRYNSDVSMIVDIVKNIEVGSDLAIETILFWVKVHDGNWARVWASYNGGYSYESKQAMYYSMKINNTIKRLKKDNCIGGVGG